METVFVGVGEFATSNNPEETIQTFGLGSCVGIIILAPRQRAGGLLHVALPESAINRKRAKMKPGTFADTAIPAVIDEMKELGAKSNSDLIVKLAGGGGMSGTAELFNVGRRTLLAVHRTLEKYGIPIHAEDVGGSITRSVTLEIESGKVIISSPGRGKWEL